MLKPRPHSSLPDSKKISPPAHCQYEPAATFDPSSPTERLVPYATVYTGLVIALLGLLQQAVHFLIQSPATGSHRRIHWSNSRKVEFEFILTLTYLLFK